MLQCFPRVIAGQAEVSVSSEDHEKESDELRHDRGELANILDVPFVPDIRP